MRAPVIRSLAALGAALLATSTSGLSQGDDTRGRQTAHRLETTITTEVSVPYLLFQPADYDPDGEKRWPLILFLHGAGERGDDLQRVKTHGPPKIAETRPDFPFLVVSPQCPSGTWWEDESLTALLDAVIEDHAVDTRRVYLTGLSMGGFGTWSLAARNPERFAAIAPICGGGSVAGLRALRDMPVWAFHGARDRVVPLQESQRMVDALRARGNERAKLTVYPDAGHDSWTEAYGGEELYEWFLSHRKPDDRTPEPRPDRNPGRSPDGAPARERDPQPDPAPPSGSAPWPPVATFSILGHDPETGEVGGAVQSRVFSVGNGVLWAEAGVGAVATQAVVDVSYGPQALALLKDGLAPEAAIRRVLEADPDPRPRRWAKSGRQLAVIDARGRVAVHTGETASDWAGHVTGEHFTAQGNILAGEAVVQAMGRAFTETEGHLSLRLLAALEAGQSAGGDKRGMQSAAMLIVKEDGGVWLNNDVVLRLQVDDHEQPIAELRRLVEIAARRFRRR